MLDEFDKPTTDGPKLDMDKDFASAPEVKAEGAKRTVEFVKEIDLGDGSGVQRFVGRTKDELIDKLTEAQTNATRKIKELSLLSSAPPNVPTMDPNIPFPEPIQLTADEAFGLQQRFLADPLGTFPEMFQYTTGMTPQEFRNQQEWLANARAETQAVSAATQFINAHDDYTPTSKNADLFDAFLTKNGLEVNLPNLEMAFNRLNASGLLERETAAASPTSARPTSTGISDSISSMTGVINPTQEQDVRNWARTAPEAEVRAYLNQLARSGR